MKSNETDEQIERISSMQYFCALEPIEINGVELNEYDFGYHKDTDPENAPEYGCGNREFIPSEHIDKEVLKRYGITEKQYRRIQEKLQCLTFGCCSLCS